MSKKTHNLHDLLAVQSSVMNQSKSTQSELMNTFKNKLHHFSKILKTFISVDENNAETASKEELEGQVKSLQTSVGFEVNWVSKFIANAIDIGYQIDVANTQAKADVLIEGEETPILTDIPVTSLLQLEKRLDEVTIFARAIPTLDPKKAFAAAEGQEKGIYKAVDVFKDKTTKKTTPLVLYQATEFHPAQVDKVVEDVKVGTVQTQEWSSLITVAQKGEILDRLEKLSRAVKKARAMANGISIEVKDLAIGKTMLDYIFKPIELVSTKPISE